MQDLLTEMQAKDVIQPSQSPWASLVMLVQNKDGSTHFCIEMTLNSNHSEYRKLFFLYLPPPPLPASTHSPYLGSRTTVTLLGCPECRQSWGWGMRLSGSPSLACGMPFGLCNGPATFQRLMDLVLAGLQMSHCLVYMDDVIVMGRSFQEHLRNLRQVFERLREAGQTLKPTKCLFFQTEVFYLGHITSRKGVSKDPAKIDKVARWPTPNVNKRRLTVSWACKVLQAVCLRFRHNCKTTPPSYGKNELI